VTIEKGAPWGEPARLPAGAVVVGSDAEAGAVLAEARRAGARAPVIGLVGGDLRRTMGGTADEAGLRTGEGVMFPVDAGTANGAPFVAHAVVRNRRWTRVVAAFNAQWWGAWNAAPRAHPNDGFLDIYDARLGVADLRKVRARLATGSHLPHPRIAGRRAAAVELSFERALPLWLDGGPVGRVSRLALGIEPDALTVVL
jgi:hypothetical protein